VFSRDSFPFLGFGLGYRSVHAEDILAGKTISKWFEAISENYMGIDEKGFGPSLFILQKIREKFPVVFHSVSMSLGSTDPLNTKYFNRLKQLAKIIEPVWISDHVCWTGVHGKNSHDLLPLPYNEETVKHVASRIKQVQDILERPILIENVSSYISYKDSNMTESYFLKCLLEEADCGLLLDVNNIFVSSFNHNFDPYHYLKDIPWPRVVQIHLAGPREMNGMLIDTHDQPVREEVWSLYREVIKNAPNVSTMIEWDDNIPSIEIVENELNKAHQIFKEVHESSRSSHHSNKSI
jgi:uncharacterized protein (UPF0276 family)